MGDVSDAEKFAQKLQLDLARMPMVVDAAPDFELYNALSLRNPSSLLQLYMHTVNFQTFHSAARSLVNGMLPTYNSGGRLTQLGGTFIISMPQNLKNAAATQESSIVYEHIDTHTGVHAPIADIIHALQNEASSSTEASSSM
eukprot:gnl/MRDRNA2_/MRDRNA2_208078_c0_seq1.p1 gnl/MRDRNA2_/MRDRNA2_208078_c0~~gnl/MRDRNA2_/MRDRNA2_208078_c0_seq1.p1  ORF type:complete len:142 (+),score=24.50 gnl/MRDRNA2_/MRDRNA2_208078_c0_seq1:126-551(+)